jgi:hypothetical protein
VVAEERRAARRPDAGRIHQILVRHRQAVERARRLASCKGFVGARGVGHRTLGHERHNRVHLRVDALDARQVGG